MSGDVTALLGPLWVSARLGDVPQRRKQCLAATFFVGLRKRGLQVFVCEGGIGAQQFDHCFGMGA